MFGLQVGLIETAYGQSCLDNDSLIHYTDEMDKSCLECLINKPKKDSLISNLSLQLIHLKNSIIIKDTLVSNLRTSNEQKEFKINKLTLSNDKTKRMAKFGTIGGVCAGVVGTILLLK